MRETIQRYEQNAFFNKLLGFSLLELMMVLTLIMLAATISQPIFQNVITHSRA